jgi:hypothetical protein
MADSGSDWQRLGEHRGVISSVAWSDDGSTLFSGSHDGEIRKWQGDRFEVLQQSDQADGATDQGDVWDMTWSNGALVASVGVSLRAYRETGTPEVIPGVTSAVTLRSHPDTNLLALRELLYNRELGKVQPRLRIRSAGSLEASPLLDSNIFARSASWHYDFAWRPKSSVLAVLVDYKITFESPSFGDMLGQSWWVGPYANAIAWISDDELAVAFGDANIRIYSWDENRHTGYDTQPRVQAKAVLEAHTSPIYAIAGGCDGQIFVSADLDGHLHLWSASGMHLGEMVSPPKESLFAARFAVHPRLPVIAMSLSNVLYRRSLDIRQSSVDISRPQPQPDGSLSRLLNRAALSPSEILTSDDAAERWNVDRYADTASDSVTSTLHLREIARLVSQLGEVAAEAMRALWREPSHKETMALENVDLDPKVTTPAAVKRDLGRLLVGAMATVDERMRTLALCAFAALGSAERAAYTELVGTMAFAEALDKMRDNSLRPTLKTFRVAGDLLRTAEDIAALLAKLYAGIRVAPSRLESEASDRPAQLKPSATAEATNGLRQVRDIIVVAARQELEAVRRCLDELGIVRSQHSLHDRMVETFNLPGAQGQNIVVGLMIPLAKGKTEMKSLLEAVKNHSRAKHVVMVGMMAGIKGKSKLLDVLAPFTIFDVSSIGTKGGRFIVEPQAGNMDAILNHNATVIDPRVFPEIELICHKNTVTFSAKIDDITHDIAVAALNVDRENVIGLEMEGSALVEMQSRHFGPRKSAYLMIKGVADYAGERPDKEEIEELKKVPSIARLLNTISDPTNDRELKGALQREATRRSFIVALELLKRLPPKPTRRRPRSSA